MAEPDAPGDEPEGDAGSPDSEMDLLRSLLSRALSLPPPEPPLEELSLGGVATFLLSPQCRRVVFLVGAGISTSAGIPDFRSPGTGLYSKLKLPGLPHPEAIFQLSYFQKHPEPFFALARELLPGDFKPTLCHYFMRLLQDKGLLLRCYTQNIDGLEKAAGLEPQKLVEAHGTFRTSRCLACQRGYDLSWLREQIFSSLVPRCESCQGLVKPDIVFFGENLPSRFFSLLQSDFQQVDLLIIMGTSLQVQPFASLVGRVPLSTPRLLINKEKTGQGDPLMSLMGFGCGMDFDSDKAYRDVAWLGECDEGCLALAELLGWKEELEELVRREGGATGTPQTSSTGGATGTGTPQTSSSGGATGTGTPQTSSAGGATGTGSPQTSSTGGATGTGTPQTSSTAGATGTGTPQTSSAGGATGTGTPQTSSAGGATGTGTPPP